VKLPGCPRSAFWRFHTRGATEDGVCTIEALHLLLRAWTGQLPECSDSHAYDNLLWYFAHQHMLVQRAYGERSAARVPAVEHPAASCGAKPLAAPVQAPAEQQDEQEKVEQQNAHKTVEQQQQQHAHKAVEQQQGEKVEQAAEVLLIDAEAQPTAVGGMGHTVQAGVGNLQEERSAKRARV
jgi:hypothetical protein